MPSNHDDPSSWPRNLLEVTQIIDNAPISHSLSFVHQAVVSCETEGLPGSYGESLGCVCSFCLKVHRWVGDDAQSGVSDENPSLPPSSKSMFDISLRRVVKPFTGGLVPSFQVTIRLCAPCSCGLVHVAWLSSRRQLIFSSLPGRLLRREHGMSRSC